MKRIVLLLLSVYLFFGCIFLPEGDFGFLAELPAMYHQCQANEHKDMNLADFITDHLINIDGVFDSHDKGDAQKPHHPFHFNHNVSISIVRHFPVISSFFILLSPLKETQIFSIENLLSFELISNVFRPPIV